jgi:hypothetical protein
VSLNEIGRLIGYKLRPGVAAETLLAFSFEAPPVPPASVKPDPGTFITGIPAEVTLAPGLAVRSVPGPNETPQVFETVEALNARPEWNAIQPWMSAAARPVHGAKSTWLKGVATKLKPGDALLIVGAEFAANRSDNRWDFRVLDGVEPDVANDRTQVTWRRPLGSVAPPMTTAAAPQVYALRRRASVYGHNAPTWLAMPAQFRTDYASAFPRASGERIGGTISDALAGGTVGASTGTIFRAAAGELVDDVAINASGFRRINEFENWPQFSISSANSCVDLDTVHSEIASGSFVVLAKGTFNNAAEPAPVGTYVELYAVTNVAEVSRNEFGLSGKVSRLTLSGANYSLFRTEVRGTSVFAQSERLELAAYPVPDAVSGSLLPANVPSAGLMPGRRLIVRGNAATGAIVHAATLVEAREAGMRQSILEIDPPLPAALLRASVVIHANVGLASHGETASQILGAGNAAVPFQKFELRQLPLTWRAAATEQGVESELTVRVDGVEWKRRDTLYDAAPGDRAYTLVDDEQGRAFVQFGDGVHGARPSSGQNNVRATYRKGLGAAGNVATGSLSLPMSRPLGLKSVSNHAPAAGGSDAENASEARASMPLMTRTLGRAVSVPDYEDFARAFAGVAKAHAQVLELTGGPAVAITVAGPENSLIGPSSPIWINLSAALAASGDPHVRVKLLPHRPATFRVGLRIKRDAAYESSAVLAAVEAALRARFGFAARALGAPVLQSDVITTAQNVAGVVAVDLDYLYGGTLPVSQTPKSRQVRLLADRMRVRNGVALADEILTLDARPFDRLEEMT